ncbi:hypothetical protein MAR_011874 [Mya arenaria]|uniref:Uncharacterized protein n=1 Tax=Mya arenaria TaxID=6604 RepID=A0ABY7FVD7_MYAAR|nr:hypothetical protein MAR_011874 [Mya arenaria]
MERHRTVSGTCPDCTRGNSWCNEHSDVRIMATFVFRCGACGLFFATLSAMQTHRCNRTLCSETARETDEAPENSGEVEVNSEQPATQASGILYNICITC